MNNNNNSSFCFVYFHLLCTLFFLLKLFFSFMVQNKVTKMHETDTIVHVTDMVECFGRPRIQYKSTVAM